MAATLTVLYTVPDDPEAFDKHYHDVHLPLVRRWPRIESAELTRVETTMGGENKYHLMTHIRFADRETLDAALAGEAGQEAGRDFRSVAPAGSFMIIGRTD